MSICPIDGRFYGDTVTIYRKTPTGISRQIAENCYLLQSHTRSNLGADSRFLLMMPWDGTGLMPGDKIYGGIGPEAPAWSDLAPERMPRVSIVGSVKIHLWEGEPSLVEATQ